MKETQLCWAVLMGSPKEFEVMTTILMAQAEKLSINGVFPQLFQVGQPATHQQGLIPIFAAMSAMQK